MAVSTVIDSSYQLDKSDGNNSNTEEDKEILALKRRLSIKLKQNLRTKQLLIDFDGGRPILSLRAPLDLVNFPSIFHPRWPIECEVINDIIHHIEWDPPEPEPFYQATGHEKAPMSAGEDRGKLVYCTDHATERPYFTCSCVGGNRGPIKSTTSCDINPTGFTLEFESRFESGNLLKAVQVGLYDYELTLRTDMYTRKHTQWFYFRLRNMKAGVTYRFTIVNLMKRSSLYSLGMKPLLYSERAAMEENIGWQRTGSDIRYYRNYNQDNSSGDGITLYSLTWTQQFPYTSDTCYLAHCYPYTYSRLQRYLRRISSNPAVASYCKLRVLCHSLAGNAVYMLTITSQEVGRMKSRSKRAVVVTARVHPGETSASWIMEGLLDFLLGDSKDAQLLRDTFIFKVVPMLNPDGVVVGNYRCSLAGRDLNRNYKTFLRDAFPCVWHTRNMVERLVAEREVVLYCDFHGHSRKNNVFMYGCNSSSDALSLKLHERVIPLMMSKNASNMFSFKSCKFRVQKSKEGTGRIAMWRLGIRNSYTMEATFGGSTLGNKRGTHFTTRDLKSIGFCLCDTLLDYCDPDPTKTNCCLKELRVLLRKQIRERQGKDLGTDLETSTSGSNSSDSDGLPVHLLNQTQTIHTEQTREKRKKKRLKTRKERNRLRPQSVKNSTKPKRSSISNVEFKLPHETTVKEVVPERPVGRHRRKWQVNGLIKQSSSPHPTAQQAEVRQVTVWQGCQPVKDDCPVNAKPAHMNQRGKACSRVRICTTVPSTTDPDQWRCPSQLLHLSALIPPSPSLKSIHPNQHQLYFPRQSCVSYRVFKGLTSSITTKHRSPSSLCVKLIPDITPPKPLLSGFTNDKLKEQFIYGDRHSSRLSEYFFVPEDPSTLHTDSATWQHEEQEDRPAKAGLSLARCTPFGEQDHRGLTSDVHLRETERHSGLFVPLLGAINPRRKSFIKTLTEKWSLDVLPPVSKTLGLDKMTLTHQQSDEPVNLQTKGTRHHSGRQRHRSPDPQEVTRPLQSASL